MMNNDFHEWIENKSSNWNEEYIWNFEGSFESFSDKLDFQPDESIEISNSLNKRTILFRSDNKKLFDKPVLIVFFSILDSDNAIEYCKWISAGGDAEDAKKEFLEYVKNVTDVGWTVEIHNLGFIIS